MFAKLADLEIIDLKNKGKSESIIFKKNIFKFLNHNSSLILPRTIA